MNGEDAVLPDCAPAETLEQRLEQAMAGLSIRSVARAAGIARGTLQGMLAGTHKGGARIDTVAAIARATRKDPGWLAFGTRAA